MTSPSKESTGPSWINQPQFPKERDQPSDSHRRASRATRANAPASCSKDAATTTKSNTSNRSEERRGPGQYRTREWRFGDEDRLDQHLDANDDRAITSGERRRRLHADDDRTDDDDAKDEVLKAGLSAMRHASSITPGVLLRRGSAVTTKETVARAAGVTQEWRPSMQRGPEPLAARISYCWHGPIHRSVEDWK